MIYCCHQFHDYATVSMATQISRLVTLGNESDVNSELAPVAWLHLAMSDVKLRISHELASLN